MNWSASVNSNWLTIFPSNGIIIGNSSQNITVSINSNANNLSIGAHAGIISFQNLTNGNGDTTRNITLNITSNCPPPQSSIPTFIQVNAATPQTDQNTVSIPYLQAQGAGNLNVIAVGWNDSASNITSISDSNGNIYELAVPTYRGNNLSQAIYYAKNIQNGANTVTVNFNTEVPHIDVRILEYSGIDRNSPFDTGNSAQSLTSGTANSGPITTTSANELIFGAGMTTGAFTSSDTGFTTRIITIPDADIAEDKIAYTVGTYRAIASVSGSWVMQVAAFKPAVPISVSLTVSPILNYQSSGYRGGPFNPNAFIYTLQNTGESCLDWTASTNSSWLNISPLNGTIQANSSESVTVSLGGNIGGFSQGSYIGTISFQNLVNGNGNTTRSITLAIMNKAFKIFPWSW